MGRAELLAEIARLRAEKDRGTSLEVTHCIDGISIHEKCFVCSKVSMGRVVRVVRDSPETDPPKGEKFAAFVAQAEEPGSSVLASAEAKLEEQTGAVTIAMGPAENGERARVSAPADPSGAGCKASRFRSAPEDRPAEATPVPSHASFLDEVFRLADEHLPMLGDAQRAPFIHAISALTRPLFKDRSREATQDRHTCPDYGYFPCLTCGVTSEAERVSRLRPNEVPHEQSLAERAYLAYEEWLRQAFLDEHPLPAEPWRELDEREREIWRGVVMLICQENAAAVIASDRRESAQHEPPLMRPYTAPPSPTARQIGAERIREKMLGVVRWKKFIESIANGEAGDEQAFDWPEFWSSVQRHARELLDEGSPSSRKDTGGREDG
jgi:hypothetical protein